MIETICQCGAPFSAPETSAGQALVCERCGVPIHIICAEPLSDGAGAGDFDAHLVIQAGPQFAGDQVLLGGVAEITFGKLPDRSIVLSGTQVSRAHCKLVRVDFGPSRWEIHDNKSTNGVFVNNQRITQQELKDGDIIRIGDYQVKFVSMFARQQAASAAAYNGPRCLGCGNPISERAKICVNCGVDVKTGRSLVVSKGLDEDELAIRADTWIRGLSWLIPFGLFPIASEAFGMKKPLSTWVIFGLTVLTSVLFVITIHSQGRDANPAVLNLLQWNGQRQQPSAELASIKKELEKEARRRGAEKELDEEELKALMEEMAPPERPESVGFHWYQPFTAALLHDPDLIMPFFLHLGGNMLFLLVFGLRVNELVGNLRMAIVYPILALGAGMIDHSAQAGQPMYPSLGASGAIMGLAGMYFIFFPAQRVHMAIWIRLGMLTRWQCFYKVFTMRGFWLLVFWIALNDLLPVFIASRDNVAHWAHLGGFMVGVVIALGLLISRQVTAMGGDLISVVLGKRAWTLVGKPGSQMATAGQA